MLLGLSVTESTRVWLAHVARVDMDGQFRILADTVFYTLLIALLAGWILLDGWLDEPTRRLVGQLAQRRGFDKTIGRTLEMLAGWRWLALSMALPCVVVTLFMLTHASSVIGVSTLARNLVLCLLFTQLGAATILLGWIALRDLEVKTARRIWLLSCIVPELVRPLVSGFPTLRTLIAAVEQVILRWGGLG